YRARGLRVGILLRGVGGDEVLEHREAVPDAVVVPDPDRRAGSLLAMAGGAQVVVLDDAFQRLDVHRDLNVCVVSAESAVRAVPWTLPAGPWREPWPAIARADAVIVTRKRADHESARLVADRARQLVRGPVAIARLELAVLRGLVSGREVPIEALDKRRVV